MHSSIVVTAEKIIITSRQFLYCFSVKREFEKKEIVKLVYYPNKRKFLKPKELNLEITLKNGEIFISTISLNKQNLKMLNEYLDL